MSETTPLVSIGLPVYNGERFVREALAAIEAQTYSNYEVIISDNASTDATGDIARAYAARDPRVRYIRNATNIGAFGNFQAVLDLGRGPLFSWLAADDLFEPRFLEACVAELTRDAHAVACLPTVCMFDDVTRAETVVPFDYLTPERWADERARFFTFPQFQHLFVYAVFRTKALRSVRFPHPALWKGLVNRSEEPFLARLATLGRFATSPEPLLRYRRHAASHATSEGAKLRRIDFHAINALVLAEKLAIAAAAPLPVAERAMLARALLDDAGSRYGAGLFKRLRAMTQLRPR